MLKQCSIQTPGIFSLAGRLSHHASYDMVCLIEGDIKSLYQIIRQSRYCAEISLCSFISVFSSKKHEISFSDLRDEPIILLNPDSIETKLLMERFSQAGVIPNIIFYSDQVYTIQHSINHEIASSFLYDTIVPRNHEIIMIPLECSVVLHISLIWKKDRYVHSGVQKIIKLAKSFKFEHYHG